MGYASDTLAEKRTKQAELEHLREFYMLWAEMHITLGMKAAHPADKQRAAQMVVDKARILKEFYA